MCTTNVSLVIHHAGKFENEKGMKYVGGKVKMVEDMLDIDRLSYPVVIAYIKEDVGYQFVGGCI